MPSRMVRDWTDSERVNVLDANGERMFIRLIMKADDFGRYHADPRLIKSFCFPLTPNVRDTDISRWLAACQKAGLVRCYSCRKGRKYLEIIDFKQRLRLMKSKYPAPSDGAPDGQPSDKCPTLDGQLPGLSPPEVEEETEQKGIEASPLVSPPAIAHEIAGYWNSKEGFRKVAHLNSQRIRKITARMKDPFFAANWRVAIDRAAKSKFCTGGGNRGWRAKLEWFLRPSKVAEIMEGTFDDDNPNPPGAETEHDDKF